MLKIEMFCCISAYNKIIIFYVYKFLKYNMSAIDYITSVPLFNGAEGSYYVVNGYKYHPCFSIHWAMNHMSFPGKHNTKCGSGPKDCYNCQAYGSIRGVFVGYCSNCLENYLNAGIWRGVVVVKGQDANNLPNLTLWTQYPYMYGIQKEDIGDSTNVKDDDE